MTKKDYILIANILKENKPPDTVNYPDIVYIQWKYIVEAFERELQHDNSHFDSDKFFKACGMA